MSNLTICRTEPYNNEHKKILAGVYNDFRNNAAKDYKFELAPLSYEKFIESIEKKLIECIVLLEDGIPTGFLVYTTLISESLELNIIHCIESPDINQKRRLLLEKFIELNKSLMREKTVIYPMLGTQSAFASEIEDFGFKCVNTAVMSFNLADASAVHKVKEMRCYLAPGYSITGWKRAYRKYAPEIICDSFKESSDALFDSRFKTYKGCSDIVSKITESIYGEFLPEITKVLLYKGHPAGFFFVNLTNEKIANIPIAAILKNHRSKGLGKAVMKQLAYDLINYAVSENTDLRELNVSCDADNAAAVSMYEYSGFAANYVYPTAYHPVSA